MAMRKDTAQIERRYLLDMMDIEGKRILEIGCGDGRMTRLYADDAHHVVAIDVGLDELKQALETSPEQLTNTVDFMAGSAIMMPFATGSFDHVVFAWSF
jgi:ubiquinone/menaquinone biosynthesis C-methylase UbiE